jgi:hypothetical protein
MQAFRSAARLDCHPVTRLPLCPSFALVILLGTSCQDRLVLTAVPNSENFLLIFYSDAGIIVDESKIIGDGWVRNGMGGNVQATLSSDSSSDGAHDAG